MKTVTLALILLFSAAGVSQQQPTKPHDVAMDKWHAMIPAIEKVLKEHNLHCDYQGGTRPLQSSMRQTSLPLIT